MHGKCLFLISISYSSIISMLSKLPYNSMTKYCLLLQADHTAVQDSASVILHYCHVRSFLHAASSTGVCVDYILR